MKPELTARKIEDAVHKAAQGVTYWLGYKSSFFDNHHVNEGAIVSEFGMILQSRLPPNLIVHLEANYGVDSIAPSKRADIAVLPKIPKGKKAILAVIEIKTTIKGRSDRDWKADLAKLNEIVNTPVKILILFTQGRVPKGLLEENGTAKRKSKVAADFGFKISRVLRATRTRNSVSKSTFNAIILMPA